MVAIKFTSIPHHGIITIPEEYREQTEGTFNVILIKENENANGDTLKHSLESIFEKYKDVIPFREIDPVEWQREQRREWKNRITR